jgi:hypothetical protein
MPQSQPAAASFTDGLLDADLSKLYESTKSDTLKVGLLQAQAIRLLRGIKPPAAAAPETEASAAQPAGVLPASAAPIATPASATT